MKQKNSPHAFNVPLHTVFTSWWKSRGRSQFLQFARWRDSSLPDPCCRAGHCLPAAHCRHMCQMEHSREPRAGGERGEGAPLLPASALIAGRSHVPLSPPPGDPPWRSSSWLQQPCWSWRVTDVGDIGGVFVAPLRCPVSRVERDRSQRAWCSDESSCPFLPMCGDRNPGMLANWRRV